MDAPPSIETYADLVAVLRGRVIEADTTFAGVDTLAGLPDRHTAAVLAPHARKIMNAYHMLYIVAALGLRLQLVPDDAALARLKQRSDWHERRIRPRGRPRKGADTAIVTAS